HAPATPHSHSLSLHDALPIYFILPLMPRRATRRIELSSVCMASTIVVRFAQPNGQSARQKSAGCLAILARKRKGRLRREPSSVRDRKSTRLNSSHQIISYAVF